MNNNFNSNFGGFNGQQGFGNQQPNNSNGFLDFKMTLNVNDYSAFTLLDPGQYPYMIKDVKHGFFQPTSQNNKIPAGCPMVTVVCEVTDQNGNSTTIDTNLFLYESMGWKIIEFFKSLGTAIDQNGQINIDFDPSFLIGKNGRCKVSQVPGQKNPNAKFNRIDKFLEPQQCQQPVQNNAQFAQPQPQQQQPQQTQQQFEQPNFNGVTGFQGFGN